MGVFPIGGERVGIITQVPRVDGSGNQIVSAYMETLFDDVTVWWDGCAFEVQMVPSPRRHEEQTDETITTAEVALVFGPVIGDQLPTVDDNGNPVPINVSDLKSDRILSNAGRLYVMRGDAVLHKDIRGNVEHAECLCEHQEG
jgi:hypothetical protein